MRRSRALVVLACALLGFLMVVAVRTRPADPEARLPQRFRLAGLIQREQRSTTGLRRSADRLRRQVADLRSQSAGQVAGASAIQTQIDAAALGAGLVGLRGPGLKVTLDDSQTKSATTGDVNDLVIHSQDVQAVVNALWRAGAEGIGVNDQRLVATTAVLCVGNTLLLNGTVHSPPYVISAIGTGRDRFDGDVLVRRLHDDAKTFGLRFSVSREPDIALPPFRGATETKFARPVA